MVAIPTIHLNGTKKENLLEGYLAQIHAIRGALDAIQNNPPNGRDFYPQGDGAILVALDEHRQRLVTLGLVKDELEKITEAIA